MISIGSFAADRCEVPQDLLTPGEGPGRRRRGHALEHAGPVVQGIASGLISADQLISLGEVLTGARPGRSTDSDIV